jgi:iron complex transport system substrate-binding protein
MNRMGRCGALIIWAFAVISLGGGPGLTQTKAATEIRMITDRTGRTVEIPVTPKRIACFFGPSYEKVFLLGAADRVVMMSLEQRPWAHRLNPRLKEVTVMPSYAGPDIERILEIGVDLAFYWQWPQQTEKMAAAGIPVVCPFSGSASPTSIEAFIEGYKQDMLFYGNVLGGEAETKAAQYCAYFDEKARMISSRTASIPKEQRPRVYYISSNRSLFSVQGRHSTTHWAVEMAGGLLVSMGLDDTFVDVSMEQVIAWNPDIIVMGGYDSTDLIMKKRNWSTLNAVKNGRVYTSPSGVFLWEKGSEIPLLLMFLAKTFHPDRFQEINMIEETRSFYRQFYRYDLTAEETHSILKQLPGDPQAHISRENNREM